MVDVAPDVKVVSEGFGPGATLSKRKAEALAQRRAKRGKLGAEPTEPIVDKRSIYCRRLRARLEFDGAAYHGWMRQPGLRTLQELVEDTLRPIVGQRVRVTPAGRTDAGVSALAQVIQFDAVLSELATLEPAVMVRTFTALERVVNQQLPPDVRVHDISVASPDFNVMSTKWKRYAYTIPGNTDAVCAFGWTHARGEHVDLALRPDELVLDIERMRTAAALLEGIHNFAAFQSRGGRAKGRLQRASDQADDAPPGDADTGAVAPHSQTDEGVARMPKVEMRTLYRITVDVGPGGLAIIMEGDGFLTHMCRILAGTILQVGIGQRDPDSVAKAFDTGLREDAGPTLPASGLCLEHVEHDEDWTRGSSAAVHAAAFSRRVHSVRSAHELMRDVS